MTRTTYRLALAVTLSLLLHISPFLGEFVHFPQTALPPPPIRAEIRMPSPPPPPPLELDKPEPLARTAPRKEATAQASSRQSALPAWQREIRRQFGKQQKDGLFYPAEAIAQGLEGEVLILMLLDENGRVAAARVEQSSGQRLLDDAALRAVRALHSLPADAPQQTIVPVRFSLH